MMAKSLRREELLEQHRYINVDYDGWWDCVYSDFKEDMKAVGIHVYRMYFSGFCSQGDGACFSGCLDNANTYLDKHHADQFPMLRKLLANGGSLTVSCEHSGHYYHQYCTSFVVDSDKLYQVMNAPTEFHEQILEQWDDELRDELREIEEAITDQWRTYMADLYRKLEAEYDALTSDEQVWDTIVANELDDEADDEANDEVCDEAA